MISASAKASRDAYRDGDLVFTYGAEGTPRVRTQVGRRSGNSTRGRNSACARNSSAPAATAHRRRPAPDEHRRRPGRGHHCADKLTGKTLWKRCRASRLLSPIAATAERAMPSSSRAKACGYRPRHGPDSFRATMAARMAFGERRRPVVGRRSLRLVKLWNRASLWKIQGQGHAGGPATIPSEPLFDTGL